MENIKKIAEKFGFDDNSYHYETNSLSIVSLEIFEPEYDMLDDWSLSNIVKFASSFKFLTSLNISISDFIIDDLSLFSDMIYMEDLYIECRTEIKDLRFLSNMKNLKSLYIESSKVDDISVLTELKGLESLSIGYSFVEDIAPLANLKSLQYLSFRSNKIEDLSAIKELKLLKRVDFSINELDDISVFSGFENLEYFNISSNNIVDLNPIKENSNLKFLDISNNKINSIDVVHNFSGLQYFYAGSNRITDISPLQVLGGLSYINISDNNVTSFKSVKLLDNIKVLISNNNLIDDLSDIHFNSQLHHLSMENSGINNLNFIRNQKELKRINFNDNNIEDFSPLEYCDGIQEILVKNNNIKENFPVQYFSKLDLVDLSNNEFGNKIFVRYYGLQRHYENAENVGLVKDLQKLNADYYFDNGDNDSALAFYYVDERYKAPEVFYIYLEKILNAPSHETVYIKYYFSRLVSQVVLLQNHTDYPNEDFEKLERKLTTVKEPERNKMLEVLENLRKGYRSFYEFNYLEFYFYEKNVVNAIVEDELIFLKGGISVNRESLMTNLYFLKLLKQRNSPFYFNLFHKIKNVLEMNFAYTDKERAEHNYYLGLLHNLESEDVTVKEGNIYDGHFNRNYQFTHFKNPQELNKKKTNDKKVDFVVVISLLLILFALSMMVKSCFEFF